PGSQTVGWLESHYQGFQDVLWAFGIGSSSSPDKGLIPGFSSWYGGSANVNPDTPIPLYLGQQFTVVQFNGSSSQNAMTGVPIYQAQTIPLNVNNFSGFLQINIAANSVDSSGNVVATYVGNQVLMPTVSYLPPIIPGKKITSLMLAANMSLIPPNNITSWSGRYCGQSPDSVQSSLKCSGSYRNTQIILYTANGRILTIDLSQNNTYASKSNITGDLGQTLQAQITYTWYGTTRTYNIPFMFNGMLKYQLPLTSELLSFVANVTNVADLQKIMGATALTATLSATLRQTAANISGMFVTPPNAYAGASGEGCGVCYSGALSQPVTPCNSSYQQGYLRDVAVVVSVSF
ncbi:hypothetical protein KDA11_05975, partial [Candidatus Saccharibacteria bacterium]|nr:hypothetical protein [Candidatus Saccharibacteria bacterium]